MTEAMQHSATECAAGAVDAAAAAAAAAATGAATEQAQPVFNDARFRRKRKNGEYEVIEAPDLPAFVADTHAHIHMLKDPAFSIARAACCDVRFIEEIVDICEDDLAVFGNIAKWTRQAAVKVPSMTTVMYCCKPAPRVPKFRFAVGCHPHNAKMFDAAAEARLVEVLHDPRVSAVGEIGLDYHYDLSPREVQRDVFRRQIRIAKEAGLPVVLHLREAHDDAFAILQDEGFPEAGALLHCYNLGPEELKRWIDAGCYIAFGGPVTFKKADEVRASARITPRAKLLTETDSPYMTPEPMRGMECGPEHVIFTASKLIEELCDNPFEGEALLKEMYENALALLDREPTAWQKDKQ